MTAYRFRPDQRFQAPSPGPWLVARPAVVRGGGTEFRPPAWVGRHWNDAGPRGRLFPVRGMRTAPDVRPPGSGHWASLPGAPELAEVDLGADDLLLRNGGVLEQVRMPDYGLW